MGYIPDIVNAMRQSGVEPTCVYTGEDRIGGYKKQLAHFNAAMPDNKKIDISFVETARELSATEVREAIRENNQEKFNKMMPIELHDEFEKMRQFA
jgi:citrate lyase synthetase